MINPPQGGQKHNRLNRRGRLFLTCPNLPQSVARHRSTLRAYLHGRKRQEDFSVCGESDWSIWIWIVCCLISLSGLFKGR
jgi:hypothetical protein